MEIRKTPWVEEMKMTVNKTETIKRIKKWMKNPLTIPDLKFVKDKNPEVRYRPRNTWRHKAAEKIYEELFGDEV